MVREREDSRLWISLCNGENLQEARLKSIIPHGDICKDKMSFYLDLQVVSFSIIQSCPLHCILASRQFLNFKILLFACFGRVVINHQKGGDYKENGPQAHLLWILVFDDQHNQIWTNEFASVCFVVQQGARRDLDEDDVMIQ